MEENDVFKIKDYDDDEFEEIGIQMWKWKEPNDETFFKLVYLEKICVFSAAAVDLQMSHERGGQIWNLIYLCFQILNACFMFHSITFIDIVSTR